MRNWTYDTNYLMSLKIGKFISAVVIFSKKEGKKQTTVMQYHARYHQLSHYGPPVSR